MILIDSREQWKDEIKRKWESLYVPTMVLKLDNYTDYVLTSDNKAVANCIAVQRKTLNEVLSQFKEIRERLPELNEYGVPWLLIEEEDMFINKLGMVMSKRGKVLYETGIKVQAYYNFLHSVERSGVCVKTTLNWEQSIWWLHSLHNYIQREHIPKPTRKYTTKEEVVGALVGIPKIGEQKAQHIYATYLQLYDRGQTSPQDEHNSIEKGKLQKQENISYMGTIGGDSEINEDEEWLREIEEEWDNIDDDSVV